jgi:sugar-specific transcriptional regulator TrmB
MEKYKRILARLGFSEYESTIYLSLLETGARNISEISKDTTYHRPVIYKVIKSLRERWYVSPTIKKSKRTSYYITDPSLLSQELIEVERLSRVVIGELVDMYQRSSDRPTFSLKEWVEELRSIHADLISSLKKWDVYHRYSSSQRDYADRNKYVPDHYFEEQKKKELERYIITSEKMLERRKGNPLRDVVAIPRDHDLFEDNITKLIYKDKVAIIDYDTASWWVIESARFANYERKIFTLLFRLLKKSRK